jgi:outer membrane protein TolC
VLDTETAYFDLLRARKAESELGSSFARLARFAATVKALVLNGRAIADDSLKIEVARGQAELAFDAARHARRRSSIVLGSFIGAYGQDDLAIAEPGPPSPPQLQNLSRNQALQARQRQLDAAGSTVDAARAERYPTFRIELTTGFVGVDPPQTIDHRGGASYDGLFSLPIFDGGAISAHIDRATAHQHQARAELRQTELELSRRLAEADSRYREAVQALALLARTRSAADDVFELGWARLLGGGHITLLEVLDAYSQAERLRLDLLDQEFAARQATAEAAQILGVNQ